MSACVALLREAKAREIDNAIKGLSAFFGFEIELDDQNARPAREPRCGG